MPLSRQTASTWQQESSGEAGNPVIAGWGADPDGDGGVNLLEHASYLPSLQAGTSSSAPGEPTGGLLW